MALLGVWEVLLALVCFLIIGYRRTSNGLPRSWPLVGMLPYLVIHYDHIHDWFTDFIIKSQGNFVFECSVLTTRKIFLTADPENANYILNTNFSNYPKGPQFKMMFDILGDGIFNADFELWKNQRKIAQMLVSHQMFKKFMINASKEKLEHGLLPIIDNVVRRGSVVDLQDVIQRFTFDATCLLVSGHDPGCLSPDFPEVVFSKAVDDAQEAIVHRHIRPKIVWKFQRWANIGHERKLKDAWKAIDRIVYEIIEERKREQQEGKHTDEDEKGIHLLASYMRLEDCDDKTLRDTTLSFLLAGRDTTSSALSWFFWLISKHNEVKENIRRELEANVPWIDAKKGKIFDLEEVKGLPYLHGALFESLRLYPPLPFEHKTPHQPDILPSGHRLTPNYEILLSLYSMGRMPSLWGDDCLDFKPERWITERGTIKHEPPYKFISFNAGPRTCLGKEVAITQMKTVAATIIHNYDIHVLEGQNISPRLTVLLHMKKGLKVRFTSRWN